MTNTTNERPDPAEVAAKQLYENTCRLCKYGLKPKDSAAAIIREALAKQTKELEQLRESVGSLRKTADGTYIVPYMTVWVIHRGEPLAVEVESVGYSIDLKNNPWGSGTVAPHEWFFSTRAAAEAAREEQ